MNYTYWGRFDIKSYYFMKSYRGNKTLVRSFRLHGDISNLANRHSSHRISDRGNLSFKGYVSLTLTGLFSAWGRGEASSAILAKSLSDYVTVLCLGQCISRHLRVCGILKRTCYFQTNWMSYILNWYVRCLCFRWRWFQVLLFWASSSNCPRLNWRTSLTTCIEVGIRQRK